MYQYLVEFLSTVFLIYIVFATGNALAIGAAYALILLIGQGFGNPAIVITMAAAGRIGTAEIIPYLLAEFLGGLVALELYKRVRL